MSNFFEEICFYCKSIALCILLFSMAQPNSAQITQEEISLFCDKRQNLSIDSVMSELQEQHKFTFFIGEDFYEFEPSTVKNLNSSKIISHKKLKDLYESLKPPITMAYFTTYAETTFQLYNGNEYIYLEFFKNRTFNRDLSHQMTKDYNHTIFEAIRFGDKTNTFIRFLHRWQNDLRNKTAIKSIDSFKIQKHYFLTRNEGPLKQIRVVNESLPEVDNKTYKVFYQLNEVTITAAFVYPIKRKHYLHLFAGRHFCQMEISYTDWTPFCLIKDISEWIENCRSETSPPLSVSPTLPSTLPSTLLSTISSSRRPTLITTKLSSIPLKTKDMNSATDLIEDNNDKSAIIVVGIVLALIVITGWAVTIAVIWIAYRETQSKRQKKTTLSSTSTGVPVSTTSSVKTVDSITGEVKQQSQQQNQ